MNVRIPTSSVLGESSRLAHVPFSLFLHPFLQRKPLEHELQAGFSADGAANISRLLDHILCGCGHTMYVFNTVEFHYRRCQLDCQGIADEPK